MTPDQAEKAIQSAFNTAWGTTTPIAWDNLDFDSESRNDSWVRLNIQNTAGTIASLGAPGTRGFRNFGTVFVQVFTPVGRGKTGNTVLATQARDVFRGQHLSGGSLWFRDVDIVTVGPDGKWYHQNVTAEFIYDDNE
jgi:hypothetical protein